ncbi:hypothetical protein D3C75_1235270 [compost metagenome]
MRLSTRQKAYLQIDDYLDLLNLANRLGDQNWQQEIIAHLAEMHAHQSDTDDFITRA